MAFVRFLLIVAGIAVVILRLLAIGWALKMIFGPATYTDNDFRTFVVLALSSLVLSFPTEEKRT